MYIGYILNLNIINNYLNIYNARCLIVAIETWINGINGRNYFVNEVKGERQNYLILKNT